MPKITAEVTQSTPDTEDIVLHFTGLAPGRAQAVARLASDLSAALADGKLDLLEDVQLGIDIKNILRP